MSREHTPAISALRTSRFTRFFAVPLTLVALFSGCYKYSWSDASHPRTTKLPDRARVTHLVHVRGVGGEIRQGEQTVVLKSPRFVGDSLVGRVKPKGGRTGDFTIAESAIVQLEAGQRQLNVPVTVALSVLGAAVLTVGILAALLASYDPLGG